VSDPQTDAPTHLIAYLQRHGIAPEFLAPGIPMPTVASAAAAIGVPEDQILKTLLFAGECGRHAVAIASGSRRVSRRLLAEATGLARPRAASPDLVEQITGYAAGGVAPFALPEAIPVIVDTHVSSLPVAYGGGGREHLLLRVDPADVIRFNRAQVTAIVDRADDRPAG
jgi:Cys-tRNA(Pro)/Cys-tRNA(Cys) deacylase